MESHGNRLTYQSNVESISRLGPAQLHGVPELLQQVIKLCLSMHLASRPAADELSRCKHFDTVPVMTCRFLDKV
jgi:hypothetical protein